MLPETLLVLIANAGRAAARERQEHEQWQREQDVERERAERKHADAVRRAIEVAHEVFRWADGPEGRELRDAMSSAALELLPLGTWAICLVPDIGHLCAWRSSGSSAYPAHARREVATATALVEVVGPTTVLALADDVRDGRVLTRVAEALRATP